MENASECGIEPPGTISHRVSYDINLAICDVHLVSDAQEEVKPLCRIQIAAHARNLTSSDLNASSSCIGAMSRHCVSCNVMCMDRLRHVVQD